MAEHVLTDAFFDINSVDLSDHVRQVTLRYNAEPQDVSAMGDGTRVRLGGLKDWSIDVEFNQDFAASEVDATLFSIVGSVVTINVKPVNTTTAATNPNFTGSVLVQDYQPIGGSVGDAHVSPVSLVAASDLTRETS